MSRAEELAKLRWDQSGPVGDLVRSRRRELMFDLPHACGGERRLAPSCVLCCRLHILCESIAAFERGRAEVYREKAEQLAAKRRLGVW